MTFDPTFVLDRIDASSPALLKQKIRAWISAPAFLDLLHMFEAQLSLSGDLRRDLTALEAFSSCWDFRRLAREHGAPADDAMRSGSGAARWLTGSSGLSKDEETRVIEDARMLGLVESRDPAHDKYDDILVLGGARLSCKLRPWRAADVLRNGVSARRIGLLGAARPVADSEREATDTYAPSAVDEFDLIVAGGQQAFELDLTAGVEERHIDVNPHLSWVVRRYAATDDGRTVPVIAVSAPSSQPDARRANSADTLMFYLEHEQVRPGSSVLLITSQIYVPYVQLEAQRTIGFPRGLYVETIGYPGHRLASQQGLANATHYLQETRSALQAALRFCLVYPD